jgi:hypothetical protein
LWRSLSALDTYRKRFDEIPGTLTNAILLGSLLVPIGHQIRTPTARTPTPGKKPGRDPVPSVGLLPLARRDIERLGQILSLEQRLRDMSLSPRAKRAVMHRGAFQETLTWMDIHGEVPDLVEHWRGFVEAAGTYEGDGNAQADPPQRRRRRRRRRPSPPPTTS